MLFRSTIVLENADEPSIKAMYAKSPYNNWVYVTLLDEQEISDALKTTRFGIVMMVLLITLLIVVIAYVISLYFTKPFRQIQRRLPVNSELQPKNEVDWIISSIDTILSEKESLEDLMHSEMPQLETQFILNLFRSRVTSEELRKSMSRFGYDLAQHSTYATMLIQLDNYGERQEIGRAHV